MSDHDATAMIEASLTDLQLIDIEIDALFTHDNRSRIVRVNEPDGEPAPRFLFRRTREGNIWRVRHDVPQHIAEQLEALAAAEPVGADLHSPPVRFDAMHDALGLARPPADEYELSYRFPDRLPDSAGAIRITHENVSLLHGMVGDVADAKEGLDHGVIWIAMMVDGAAVSHCYSCRLTDRAAEAGVETLGDYRGRGYAPAVVTAWARAVRETGRIPFYGTSWDNLASQAVARKLGLIHYGGTVNLE